MAESSATAFWKMLGMLRDQNYSFDTIMATINIFKVTPDANGTLQLSKIMINELKQHSMSEEEFLALTKQKLEQLLPEL